MQHTTSAFAGFTGRHGIQCHVAAVDPINIHSTV